MNILFNTYPIAFHTPGGGEIQLIKTKNALEARGVHVMLYDQWAPQIQKSDVVHYFSVYGCSSVFCDFVKAQNKPLAISSVLYPHKDIYQYPMAEISHMLRTCDIILPNSQHEAELLSRVCDIPLDKFYPVYNGVDQMFLSDPEFDGSLFRNHFGIDGPFLLSIANIEDRKNQIALSEALSKTDLVLIILGHIRDNAYYHEMIRVSNGKIRYLGYLPNDSDLLRSALLACELFILPSKLETPGLAALEAAAMGAKVVITCVGSTCEYFGDMVYYLDPDDKSTILPAILDALDDESTPQLKEHVRSNYTWEQAAIQTIEAYQAVLG